MCGVKCGHAENDPACRCWGIWVPKVGTHAVFPESKPLAAFGNRARARRAAVDANAFAASRGGAHYEVCRPS